MYLNIYVTLILVSLHTNFLQQSPSQDVLINKLPYLEHHGLMDGRLAICGVAVAVAMFALLWDYLYPFPMSRSAITDTGFLICCLTWVDLT